MNWFVRWLVGRYAHDLYRAQGRHLRAPGARGEHGGGAGEPPPGLVEDFERAGRERYAVLGPGLHARGGDRPHRAIEVELLPARVADLARAGRGEHQELQRQYGAGVGARRAHLGVRQGALVAANEMRRVVKKEGILFTRTPEMATAMSAYENNDAAERASSCPPGERRWTPSRC